LLTCQETGDKKQKIMTAAAQVFAAKGFHQARMEEIAQAADMGKSTVYEYFSSKQDLFAQMFQNGCQMYQETLTAALRPEMGVRDQLVALVQLHLRFILQHQNIGRMMMQDKCQLDGTMHQQLIALRQFKAERISTILQEGIRQGIFREMNCDLTARLLIGAVNDLAVPPPVSGLMKNPDHLAGEIVDLFIAGIGSRV